MIGGTCLSCEREEDKGKMEERSDMGNKGDKGDQGNQGDRRARNAGPDNIGIPMRRDLPAVARAKRDAKAGYEYLLAYKITVPIYDYTVVFCDRWIGKQSRTYEQMVQAGRSGMQNIAEGNKHVSLKGYIYLTGIARGSLEELLKDYLSYARQRALRIWEIRESREIGEVKEVWKILRATPTLPDTPNFPDLPSDPEKTVNLLVTLINQANYLLDKLIVSLKDKHMREGGLTENLYRARIAYRAGNDRGDKGDRG